MAIDRQPTDASTDRGLSPVVGVLLLVGVIVAVGAVAAVFVGASVPGISDDREVARFEVVYNETGPSMDVTHTGGESLYGHRVFVEDDDGDRANWSAIHPDGADATVGTRIQVDDQQAVVERDVDRPCAQPREYEYLIVRYTRDGEREVLKRYELPEHADCP
jgi:FlaG/FlaF family flagellin (archaellin)